MERNVYDRKFLINRFNSKKSIETDIQDLSSSLKIDDEIFDISEKEIFLGSIKKQTLLAIATDIVDYGFNNYIIAPNRNTDVIKEAISFVGNKIKENEDEMEEAFMLGTFANLKTAKSNFHNTCFMIQAIESLCLMLGKGKVTSSFLYNSTVKNVVSAARCTNECFDITEKIRQGKLVLQHLNSDKNLFW
jgi:hypothetical protein